MCKESDKIFEDMLAKINIFQYAIDIVNIFQIHDCMPCLIKIGPYLSED